MKIIKFYSLICFFIICISAPFNISATENKNEIKFTSILKQTKKSVVLLSVSPNVDPSKDFSQNAMCSGIVVDDIGHVLTNFHCVYKQNYIKIYYHDENDWQTYNVNVIGLDPLADLALLEVMGREESVPFLKFADDVAEIEEGTEVYAIGHPMGMTWTISKGIISSNQRYARHPYIKVLQTDAAINKGNSGGPLMNMRGELIGINTLIISRISENAGVGLAIRGDIVKKSFDTMLKYGRVDRPAVGVMIKGLATVRDRKKFLKEYPKQDPRFIPNTFGLLIMDDKVPKGLKAFDTIIGVNDVVINDGLQFSDELGKNKIGDIVTLTIIRKRVFLKVDVTLKVFPVPTEKMYGKTPTIPTQ
jgi:S1-C subfamily serine protease